MKVGGYDNLIAFLETTSIGGGGHLIGESGGGMVGSLNTENAFVAAFIYIKQNRQ